MATAMSDVVQQPDPGNHLVQIYSSDAFLAALVADYLAAGLGRQEAALVIAMPLHVGLFSRALAERGVDVPAYLVERRLLFLDAERTLARFMVDGRPDEHRFTEVITAAVQHVRSGQPRGVRLYGEMVDLLWSRSLAAAIELERLWNDLLAREQVSLLCAYRLDALDPDVQSVLHQVTRCHSHVLPTEQHERLQRAVDRAYTEVFGASGDAQRLRELMVSMLDLRTAMPDPEAALLALETLPEPIARDVRARAQHHYAREERRAAKAV